MTIGAFRVLSYTVFFHFIWLFFLSSDFANCSMHSSYQLPDSVATHTLLKILTFSCLSFYVCVCLYAHLLSVFLSSYECFPISSYLYYFSFYSLPCFSQLLWMFIIYLFSLCYLCFGFHFLFSLFLTDCFCNSLGMIFLIVCLFILLLIVSIYSLFVC